MAKQGKGTKKQSTNGNPPFKPMLHGRNRFKGRYDFSTLISEFPALASFVRPNPFGDLSVDFFDPEAVRMLNAALLFQAYGLRDWNLPPGYLCPPVPGRADYIHHIADLLTSGADAEIPRGSKIRCLDIGTGASCIYPIIGHAEYGWSFVATDIDPESLDNCRQILSSNPPFSDAIELRLQVHLASVFRGVISPEDKFDACVCNPPFHASADEARAASVQKNSNLRGKVGQKPSLNFGGQKAELWCEGGEGKFIATMARESKEFALNCKWFTSLVSKESNLEGIKRALRNAQPKEIRIIPMGQGKKVSRIVAWTFQ